MLTEGPGLGEATAQTVARSAGLRCDLAAETIFAAGFDNVPRRSDAELSQTEALTTENAMTEPPLCWRRLTRHTFSVAYGSISYRSQASLRHLSQTPSHLKGEPKAA